MAEISLNEAMGIAKQMRNHFRVFEKLEKVLRLLTNAEQVLKEKEELKEALNAEIEELETKRKEVREGFKRSTLKLTTSFNAQQQEINEKLDALEHEAKNKVKEYADREALAKRLADEAEANYQKVANRIAEDTEIAREELKAIRATLANLKDSITKVGG